MTTKERLQEFAKESGYGRNKFENFIGISEGNLSSKSESVNSDTIEKVIEKFPNLNLRWLFTGVGQMVLPEQENNTVNNDDLQALNRKYIEVLEENRQLHKEVGLLKDSGFTTGRIAVGA